MSRIVYTLTDESPFAASHSLLPIVQAFARQADVTIETRDISLGARILAQFSDRLEDNQRQADALAELGALATTPEANIVKLPNISASIPQIKRAIAELRAQGFDLPEYPDDPADDDERETRARYDRVKGSAVNPVLREGNSDRRAPQSVKNYARKHPHVMGPWSRESRTTVATMGADDFRSNERSWIAPTDDTLSITLTGDDGSQRTLRAGISVQTGDVVDATVLRAAPLREFLTAQVRRAKDEDLLFSVHLKATMMKVSDPIIFGHVIRAFFDDVFARFGSELANAGISPNDGLGSIFAALDGLEHGAEIRAAFQKALADGPALAMVDVARGTTNLHVPSDVIIDASMPAMIRWSGKMTGPDGAQHDTLAVIPDSSYAGIYQTVIEDCRVNGAFDPSVMGSVPNVGLMAGKAEEYGSHDKTFEIPVSGTVRVTDGSGAVVLEHDVAQGDIWRACVTKDIAIKDWVALAVTRARATGTPTVFWLDPARAHDTAVRGLVERYLKDHDTDGLEIRILSLEDAMRLSLERIRRGEDTISVTGNVLRDYLTDLFPIMELGTSAKMLSVVPLLQGGGLFETGAGGSAPVLFRQLLEENHLSWDSLGEFLALAVSFEHLAEKTGNTRARVLAETLDRATGTFLEENRSPQNDVGSLDSRGSHVALATAWSHELAVQQDDAELAERFSRLAARLSADEPTIMAELLAVQGTKADIGGYYRPDEAKADAVMRPSATFNAALEAL